MSKVQFSEAKKKLNTFGEANGQVIARPEEQDSQQLFIGEIFGYITFWCD